ncbi:cytoplasmic protein [Pseudoalteromonas sp. T1lg122]|uniref:cytoplasmic protein n=1 Tax=Pseudoalteromonas sp. T1lg122 TaxID=2077094 RepID=UPI000CF68F02|nr:cytoplasmic protein [Pseudoalteromonas sp. T1lg122]
MNIELRIAAKAAHKKSIRHRDSLRNSDKCGCFYCLNIFGYQSIEFWTDNDDTALCPSCGIDSVIGDDSGYPITKEFLSAMRHIWFDE